MPKNTAAFACVLVYWTGNNLMALFSFPFTYTNDAATYNSLQLIVIGCDKKKEFRRIRHSNA